MIAMQGSEKQHGTGIDAPWRELEARLHQERVSRNWFLVDLARRLHVSKGYVSRLKHGKACPAATMITRLGNLWKLDTDSLLISAGFLPEDVKRILHDHAVEAVALLRGSFSPESVHTDVE